MASNNLSDFMNEFSFKLYKYLAKTPENCFISPFSISTALCMCYVGAKNETHTQLKQLLCYSKESDEKIMQLIKSLLDELNSFSGNDLSLNIANKIFVKENYEIRKEFVNTITKYFDSEIENLNFKESKQSADVINSWVSNKTKNKITNLIDANMLNDLTRLILINAIYFKANWQNKFEKSQTQQEDFHLANGSTVKVDMMRLLNKKFNYLFKPNGLNADVCKLPYVGNNISMTIILPHENSSLTQIEDKLNSNILKDVLKNNKVNVKVRLFLPKFKLEHKIELSDSLIKLGSSLAFDREKADFTGIYPIGELCISKVIHQAIVEVNEEGTEAAAATAVAMVSLKSIRMEEPILDFNCNRPFIFLIHENTNNSILFMGRYTEP